MLLSSIISFFSVISFKSWHQEQELFKRSATGKHNTLHLCGKKGSSSVLHPVSYFSRYSNFSPHFLHNFIKLKVLLFFSDTGYSTSFNAFSKLIGLHSIEDNECKCFTRKPVKGALFF